MEHTPFTHFWPFVTTAPPLKVDYVVEHWSFQTVDIAKKIRQNSLKSVQGFEFYGTYTILGTSWPFVYPRLKFYFKACYREV